MIRLILNAGHLARGRSPLVACMRRSAWTLSLLTLLVPSVSGADVPAKELVFHLVPLQYWGHPEGYREKSLPTGTVRLYKVGSHEPGLLAKVNEPVTIPQGQWTWIAEAPGFVSVAAGSVNVGEECRATGKPHPFYMWVVPACSLLLDDSRGWSSIQRLDMVSLSYGAV
ncbi:MAG: hypothetical protein GY856_35705 [bacterium]|nr:hypothetical protein [bacterium]